MPGARGHHPPDPEEVLGDVTISPQLEKELRNRRRRKEAHQRRRRRLNFKSN